MAKNAKYFDIPRGADNEADDIRQALINKLKQQENANKNQSAAQAGQYVASNPNYQAQQPAQYTQQPQQQQNMSYQQYQQNRQLQNNQQQATPSMNSQRNLYSGYGTYSSPFADKRPSVNADNNDKINLVDATHSKEPIKYKPKKRKSAGKTFLFLILMIAIIFGLSWAMREFVFQAYEIPSGSMEKTIMTGDMVFAEKISTRFSTPKNGDIVTFLDPQNEGRILIKRVIASAGQTVDIKDNKLFVDNEEQDEPYVNNLPTTLPSRSSVKFPYKVPDDCIWVMGDNRTNSQDSRYFGAIPTSSIIGRAMFVYWPFENWKVLE